MVLSLKQAGSAYASDSADDPTYGIVIASVTVTTTTSVTAANTTYTGSAYSGAVIVTVSPLAATGTTVLTYHDDINDVDLGTTPPTNAGTYTVTATFTSNTNAYTSSFGTATFTIDKANASVTISNYTGTYDGNSHTASVTIKGVNGETLASASKSGTNVSDSGSVSTSLTGNPNYNNVAEEDATATLAINAKQITGSITAQDKVYNGSTAATVTTALSGVLGTDEVFLTGTATFSDKNVGVDKTVTLNDAALSGAAAGNYTLAPGAITDLATITAKALGDFSSGTVQAALDLAKQGTVSFALTVGGIEEGDSLAAAFNDAKFTLSMCGESCTFTAKATVIGNVVYIDINLKGNTAFYNFLAQGLDNGETSASRASWETIKLTATSNDGNYTISEDVLTRIFKSTK
ncbi:MAG: YDG domain-containing protein [Gemmataceae bacterium]